MTSISAMNWSQVEEYLRHDDRCIVPVGCTEQHAFLSLSTDSLLAEKISLDAAEPLHIPVFPVMHYGITPRFMAYPGTVTLREETLAAVLEDILESLYTHGFRRIMIVNGHGGNSPVAEKMHTWAGAGKDVKLQFVNWWIMLQTWAKVQSIDPVASHASWMENFPWTRLKNVKQPHMRKPAISVDHLRTLSPAEAREYLGDGNFAGYYEKGDEVMMEIWETAVGELREMLGKW